MTMIIYADFNCPYCYLASQRADLLMRHGRADVDWRAVEHDPGLLLAGRRPEAGRPAWAAEIAELAGLAEPGEGVPAVIDPGGRLRPSPRTGCCRSSSPACASPSWPRSTARGESEPKPGRARSRR